MKWIDKSKAEDPDLKKWHDYQLSLGPLARDYADSEKTGDHIFSYIANHRERFAGDTLGYSKQALKKMLLEEQGYICCYCGKRIELNHHSVIEHLYPKSLDKEQTFKYSNLLASCDGGKSYKFYYKLESNDIKSSNQATLVALEQKLGLSRGDLLALYIEIPAREHKKHLKALYDIERLKAGDRLFTSHFFNRKHCDHKKEDKSLPLGPTRPDIETYFEYLPTGEIRTSYADDLAKQKKIKDTVEILGLNTAWLKEERKTPINKARQLKRKILHTYGAANYKKMLAKLIQKHSTADSSGKLAPYCFVLVANLK